jgi:hypothetical protein
MGNSGETRVGMEEKNQEGPMGISKLNMSHRQ